MGVGKALSLGTKLFAGLFVCTMFILNGAFHWGYEVNGILAIGAFIAASFVPVDISKIGAAVKNAGPQEGKRE